MLSTASAHINAMQMGRIVLGIAPRMPLLVMTIIAGAPDDLGGERVVERFEEDHCQGVDQAVGPLAAVDRQHRAMLGDVVGACCIASPDGCLDGGAA
jgi:hypothetical protein